MRVVVPHFRFEVYPEAPFEDWAHVKIMIGPPGMDEVYGLHTVTRLGVNESMIDYLFDSVKEQFKKTLRDPKRHDLLDLAA